MLRRDQPEPIGGGMILGKGSVLASLEQSDRKVEPRRAILSLVITIGTEVAHDWCGGILLEDMHHRAVDKRVAATAFLVRRGAAVANAGNHKPMLDAADALFVEGEPSDRADRAWRKQETVGVSPPTLR